MYIKDRMTEKPYTIQADAPVMEVMELMREKNLKRVPVLDGEKLCGLVTDGDIEKVSPTKATSLSVFELNYLLSNMTVQEAMTKKVITISPGDILEEAAVLMRSNRVSALPVVEDGMLVGIITESDIFDAFIDLLGAREIGTRLVVKTKDGVGILSNMTQAISKVEGNIRHIAALHNGDGTSDVLIRVDTLYCEPMIQALEAQGYEIMSVVKNRTEMQ